MSDSKSITFEQMLESGVLSFASRCLYWTEIEVACDLIDRLYAEALNPDSEYYKRSREVIRIMTLQSKNKEPSDSDETCEIYAYLRAQSPVGLK